MFSLLKIMIESFPLPFFGGGVKSGYYTMMILELRTVSDTGGNSNGQDRVDKSPLMTEIASVRRG